MTLTKNDQRAYFEHLAERFFEQSHDILADHELLELMLFFANPRQDVKLLAKILLKVHGNLKNILHAPMESLKSFRWNEKTYKLSDVTTVTLMVVGEIAERKYDIDGCQVLKDWEKIQQYYYGIMAYLKKEELHLLFLDKKNCVIKDEVQQVGTLDHICIYPREIIERSMLIGARSVILIHNHPSGDSSPSTDDITMTRQVKNALHTAKIDVFDHLIVGRRNIYSFKDKGIL